MENDKRCQWHEIAGALIKQIDHHTEPIQLYLSVGCWVGVQTDRYAISFNVLVLSVFIFPMDRVVFHVVFCLSVAENNICTFFSSMVLSSNSCCCLFAKCSTHLY
uniref:Uncharacterized protein n=1 Tax=Spongospora subterranea TaxID=70186 RepID=A0A0H5R9M8_9EUKA|eukprot:CRZ10830.1 hypothetical protein [Spongospora subterranea]